MTGPARGRPALPVRARDLLRRRPTPPQTAVDRYRSRMASRPPRSRRPRWVRRFAIALALGGAVGAAGGVSAVNRLEPGHPGGIDSLALVKAPARAAQPDTALEPLPKAPPAASPADESAAESAGAALLDSLAAADSADPLALTPQAVDSLARLDSLADADSVARAARPRRRPDTLPPAPLTRAPLP